MNLFEYQLKFTNEVPKIGNDNTEKAIARMPIKIRKHLRMTKDGEISCYSGIGHFGYGSEKWIRFDTNIDPWELETFSSFLNQKKPSRVLAFVNILGRIYEFYAEMIQNSWTALTKGYVIEWYISDSGSAWHSATYIEDLKIEQRIVYFLGPWLITILAFMFPIITSYEKIKKKIKDFR